MIILESFNELFHLAENPPERKPIKNEISPGSFVRTMRELDRLVPDLLKFYAAYRQNPALEKDFYNYISKLSNQQRALISEYLLKLAEFCQLARDHDASIKALGAIDALVESGVPMQRYETQIN